MHYIALRGRVLTNRSYGSRAGPGRAAAPHFNAYNTVICEGMPCNRQSFRLALQHLALHPLSSRTDPARVPLQQRDSFRIRD